MTANTLFWVLIAAACAVLGIWIIVEAIGRRDDRRYEAAHVFRDVPLLSEDQRTLAWADALHSDETAEQWAITDVPRPGGSQLSADKALSRNTGPGLYYHDDDRCTDPPEVSCSDVRCPVHGEDNIPPVHPLAAAWGQPDDTMADPPLPLYVREALGFDSVALYGDAWGWPNGRKAIAA